MVEQAVWISYGANGNIVKYLRKRITGNAAHMDSLNYFYYTGTNRLKQITESIPPNMYTSSQDNLILNIDGQFDNNQYLCKGLNIEFCYICPHLF